MPKDLGKALLYDLYGPLMSERQREIFECYYYEDLSLAEIAVTFGITRQAALNSIKKSEARLIQFEKDLGFEEKFRRDTVLVDKISDLANGILAGEDAKENSRLIIKAIEGMSME